MHSIIKIYVIINFIIKKYITVSESNTSHLTLFMEYYNCVCEILVKKHRLQQKDLVLKGIFSIFMKHNFYESRAIMTKHIYIMCVYETLEKREIEIKKKLSGECEII